MDFEDLFGYFESKGCTCKVTNGGDGTNHLTVQKGNIIVDIYKHEWYYQLDEKKEQVLEMTEVILGI